MKVCLSLFSVLLVSHDHALFFAFFNYTLHTKLFTSFGLAQRYIFLSTEPNELITVIHFHW